MKIRFEATESRHHEGVVDLSEEEAEEYRSLTTADERTEWLHAMVQDLVNDDLHCGDTEVEDGWFAAVEDEDDA